MNEPARHAGVQHEMAQVRVFSLHAGLVDGVPITAPPFGNIEDVVISILQQRAQQFGRPTAAHVVDDRYGSGIRLLIHPDGSTEPLD
ncbi:hypothetical protein IHE55_15600 [Streptomyces pactum]|uniref:Uncharacterized protein n=1 Tax=Streptomyces pactum TaxID=68249 RepID=A0ABS0NLQ9_9ACTN|nr:hypothetical protein [Streptomyces pactum]MBH5336131.1 hypothetical protein [Streptomyces pactum]